MKRLPSCVPWLPCAALALAATMLAHCSGGGSAAPRTVTSPSPTSTTAGGVTPQSVTITILVPHAPTTSATTRSPKYVSSSTQSATAVVTDSLGTRPAVTANVSTTNGTSQIVLTVTANVGNDQFQLTLFDGLNGAGNVLSAGSVASTIVAGSPNAVTIVNGGVVNTFVMTLSSTVAPGTASTLTLGYKALDADGNTIMGTFDTPVTLAVADTTGVFTLSTTSIPNSSTPVTLAYSGAATVTSTTISASTQSTLTSKNGTNTSTLGSVSVGQAVPQYAWALGLPNPCYGCSEAIVNVAYYPPVPASSATPMPTPAIAAPAFDPNGNVWFNSDATHLRGITPTGATLATVPFTETLLAFDTSSRFYTRNGTAALLDVYAFQSGYVPAIVRSMQLTDVPCAVAVDTTGAVYVSTCGSASVGAATYHYPTGSTTPDAVASGAINVQVDASNNAYAIEPQSPAGPSIAMWSAGTAISAAPKLIVGPAYRGTGPESFAVQPSGDICYSENINGLAGFLTTKVSAYSPSGKTGFCPSYTNAYTGAGPGPPYAFVAAPIGSPVPTPAPTATPAPTLVAAPASLAFNAVGASASQTVTLAYGSASSGYAVSATSPCLAAPATVAVTQTTASGPAFSVTPLQAGSCNLLFTGPNASQVTVPIVVTTSTVVAQ